MIPQVKQARIPELDGLRGIAILIVLSFHYLNNQLVNSANSVGKLLYEITSLGWAGVDLFFVLSGFLITTVLIRNKFSKNYFSTFYVRRIVRIIPNYFLLIVIFLILLRLAYFNNNHFLTGNNVLPAWSYFTMVHNLFMARLDNMGTDAMSITWSIGIEEQFYVLFPFIVYFLNVKLLPYFLGFAILLALIFRTQFNTWIPPYVLLPCRMDAISFGAMIAYFHYYYDLKTWVSKNLKWLMLLVFCVICVCAYMYYKYKDLGNLRNTYFGICFSFCLIVALTKTNTLFAKLLRNPVLMWVGTISYSLYLFHYMILGIFHHVFGKVGISISNSQDILITILALICSLLFSYLIFKKLETPMVNIGKRFRY